MTSVEDLRVLQATAAKRYEAALRELYESWVGLSALDHAVANARVGGDLRTFGSNLDDQRTALHAHPLVSDPDPVPLSTRVTERRDELLEHGPG